MANSEVDAVLYSIISALIGFLLGSVFSEIPVTTADISSMIIAVAAMYGILKWRKQHDYQQEKIDKKEIIKLVKKSFAYSLECRLTLGQLSKDLASYVREKNDDEKRIFNQALVEKSLNRLETVTVKLSETGVNIEAEAAINSVIESDTNLQFHLHCLINLIEDYVLSANATTLIYQNFEVINQTDDADFDDMEEDAELDFFKYLDELKKVEGFLNIHKSSLARYGSRQYLKKKEQQSNITKTS